MGERAEHVQSVGIQRIIPLRLMQIRVAASQPECLDEARVWFLSPGYTTYDSTWAEMAKPWDIWL